MGTLRPTADVSSDGWSKLLTGETPIWSNLQDSTSQVHRQSRITENRRWFLIGCDDARWDYIGTGAMLKNSGTCLRKGQPVMEDVQTEIIDKGVSFLAHRTTLGPCWTARAEWHSALTFFNHGMTAESTASPGYLSDYIDHYIDGRKTGRPRNTSVFQWQGPWGQDLAFQAGYGRQRVTHAQQLADNVLRPHPDIPVTTTGWFLGSKIWTYPNGTDISDISGGDSFTCTGNSNSAFNGTFTITSINNTQITVIDVVNPGSGSGGTITIAHDKGDDLQAFTGGVWQQLEREGIPSAFFGKLTNPRDRAQPVPAGISYCAIQLEDGPNSPVVGNDQYNLWIQEFVMNDRFLGGTNYLNPWDGSGYTNDSYTLTSYVAIGINGISHSGGIATLTANSNTGVEAGDQITITNNTSYNGTWTVLTTNGNHTVLTFATSITGGSGGSGSVYNRALYAPFLYWKKCKAWLDQMDDSQPFFVNITTRLPHDNAGGYNASTHEKEYESTVDEADAEYWLGSPGVAPPVNTTLSSTEKETWADSLQMMASINDLVRLIVDYATPRYGAGGYGIILVSDQGLQNGDQSGSYVNADGDTVPNNGDGGGKTSVWDSSARSFMYVRGPRFGDGVTPSVVTQPTMHADLALTLLDLYGIEDSHWHQTKDGRSLLRVTDSGDVAFDRMIPIFGTFKLAGGGSNRGWCIVDKANRKYIQLNHLKSSGKFFWPDPNVGTVVYNGNTIHPAYEQNSLNLTSGDNDIYDAALDVAFAFRYDVVNETHPAHTTASP